MNRNKLYLLLSVACLAGYIWLMYAYTQESQHADSTVCVIKHVTGIPCPSCGSTRSVLSFLHGDLIGALRWNPFGVIIILILGITPFWITYDWSTRKESLFVFYKKTEQFLRRRWVAIPLITLVIGNWIWNICKEL